jgi:hypothetical protein
MRKHFLIYRLVRYYQRKGFIGTVKRLKNAMTQILFPGWDIILCCESINLEEEKFPLPQPITINKIEKKEDINDEDLKNFARHIGDRVIQYDMLERFPKGAILWLVKYDDQLAGFLWTIKGKTIEPFYFPLMHNDAYLFDGGIFEEFRGMNIYPLFLTQLLYNLKIDGAIRSYFVAHEWNKSVLRAFSKTPSKIIGAAKISYRFDKIIVLWSGYNKSEHHKRPTNPLKGQ